MDNKAQYPKKQFSKSEKQVVVKISMAAFFAMTLLEVTAEYFQSYLLIKFSKPLLVPLLILLYMMTCKKVNKIYLLSLICVGMGNLLFELPFSQNLIIGTLFFTAFRILMIYELLKTVKLPGVIPMLIGCLPFLFSYFFVLNLSYNELGDNFYIYALQGIFPILFSGIALGAYTFKPNKPNTFLLISMMFFTCTQFMFVIEYFFISLNIFKPLLMLLYMAAHFWLYKFIIAEESICYKKSKIKKAKPD